MLPKTQELVKSLNTLLTAREAEGDMDDLHVRLLITHRGWVVEVAPEWEDPAEMFFAADTVLSQDMSDDEVVMAAYYLRETAEELLAV